MVLMCRNRAVYRIETEETLCRALLPGSMSAAPGAASFNKWMKLRYSGKENTFAQRLGRTAFGRDKRALADAATRALSLSDAYWLKQEVETVRFEDVSPYYQHYWKGAGRYPGGAVPTLYAVGRGPKAWLSDRWLYKWADEIEAECSRLCRLCGVPCAEAEACWSGGVLVRNFTSPSVMLEQADMSGRFDRGVFTSDDLLRAFGLNGFKMQVLDAIFGNPDRNPDNFGFLRSTASGEYLGMCPLYDFDRALYSGSIPDRLLHNVLDACECDNIYYVTARRAASAVRDQTTEPAFRSRASFLLREL